MEEGDIENVLFSGLENTVVGQRDFFEFNIGRYPVGTRGGIKMKGDQATLVVDLHDRYLGIISKGKASFSEIGDDEQPIQALRAALRGAIPT